MTFVMCYKTVSIKVDHKSEYSIYTSILLPINWLQGWCCSPYSWTQSCNTPPPKKLQKNKTINKNKQTHSYWPLEVNYSWATAPIAHAVNKSSVLLLEWVLQLLTPTSESSRAVVSYWHATQYLRLQSAMLYRKSLSWQMTAVIWPKHFWNQQQKTQHFWCIFWDYAFAVNASNFTVAALSPFLSRVWFELFCIQKT